MVPAMWYCPPSSPSTSGPRFHQATMRHSNVLCGFWTLSACLLYSQLGFLGRAIHAFALVCLLSHRQVRQACGHDAARLSAWHL